jgi:hypothetical protein
MSEPEDEISVDWILQPLPTPTIEESINLWTDDNFGGIKENNTKKE